MIYCVKVSGKKTVVCKKAFISIHGLKSDRRIRRLGELLQSGKSPRDMRGQSIGSRSRAVKGDVIDKIKEHIESFEVKVAHYANREIKYLKADLNAKIMHSLFLEKYPGLEVKYEYYLKYLHENYNYRFGRPQKDVCSRCEEYKTRLKNLSLCDSVKRAIVAERMVHIRRSKKFYKKIEAVQALCKHNDDVAGLCMDFMQNLPLPCIPVQEVFYLRQLWVNTFCIYDLKTGNSYFFLYHEGVAKKGANESCSFLHAFFKEHYFDNNIKEVHIFSDGCPGQNRNNTVVRYLLALAGLGKFRNIFQYFPVRGHSFLPCDRVFGVIKRKLKNIDRVYTVREYTEHILQSTKKHNAFTVNCLEENSIVKNSKDWWPYLFKRNTLSIESMGKDVGKTEKINFSVSQYFMCEYHSNNPGVVVTRPMIDGLLRNTFRLLKPQAVISLPTTPAHGGRCPVNNLKLQDIKKLQQYIPEEHKSFYDEIINWPTTNLEIEDDV